ncbi:MAG: hypothetical protein JXB03_03700 [Spirochaetales bacterium]|nr:hypothetical protein [Spirochaetales bacterium]
MELGIYLLTAILCIAWSIKMYNDWYFSAHFDEGDLRRVVLLVVPGSVFILSLLLTWAISDTFRLDILTLLFYDAVIIISVLTNFIAKKALGKKRGYITGVVVFLVLSAVVLACVFLIRQFPLLLMKITFYLSQIGNVAVLESFLFSFEPESETEAMVSLLNKVVIAFFSYLPITIVRFLYFRRSQQRLRNEIQELRKRVISLESVANHE